MRPLYALALLGALAAPATHAQIQFGADVVSRYVWRGYDFGEAASIQPSLAYTAAGTTVSTWASYPFTPDGALADEHDFAVAHTFPMGGAALTVGVQDYYFPNAGPSIFDFDDGGNGAHYVEPYLAYTGDAAVPITLLAAVLAYNDPTHAVYLEAGYPQTVAGTQVTPSVGVVMNESAFYGTDGAALTNVSLRAGRTLDLGAQFKLPLWVQFTLNPYEERSYLVFGARVGVVGMEDGRGEMDDGKGRRGAGRKEAD